MADALPAEVAALVDRIAAPEPRDVDVPADITGVLAELLTWWRSLAGSATVTVATVGVEASASAFEAVLDGAQAADRAIDAGATLVVPTVRHRDDVAARTVIALLTRREASAVVGQPPGMTDRAWMQVCADVRDRAAECAAFRGEPLALLDAVSGPGIAATAGVLLAAAARRTPCLIDGTDELAAALVADRICFRAKGWWRAGSDSVDPGRSAAIDRIDLTPGLPLRLSDDAGRGAQATLALLDQLT